MDRLLLLVREEFEKILQQKTGWGRNEIISAFDKAWVIGMSRYAREKGIVID